MMAKRFLSWPFLLGAALVVTVAFLLFRRCRWCVIHMKGNAFAPISVYTVTNNMKKPELLRLARSVARAGGHLRVIYIPCERIGRMPIGYGAKITYFARVLASHSENDIVCFVDAFDVLFAGPLSGMLETYHDMVGRDADRVVFSAEPWCWPTGAPYEDYCPRYPSDDKERYRFLNSGVYMGRCGTLRRLFADHAHTLTGAIDDQGWFGARYLDGLTVPNPVIVLDHRCRLFQNLIGHNLQDHFDWDGPARRWRNRSTGTVPYVLHGNGPTESRKLLFDQLAPPLESMAEKETNPQ